MKAIRPFFITALLSLLPLAACEQGALTDPADDDLALADLSFEDQLSLELLADPATTEAALDLTDTQTGAAFRKGWGPGSNAGRRNQAEQAFREAGDALAQGDLLRARDRARDGRRLVSESIQLAGGASAIEGMVERTEALTTIITADPDAFANPGKLGLQIGKIATMAREASQSGDQVRAGAMGVLAEQAFRHQRRNHEGDPSRRASLAVALADEAVGLATRILDEQVPTADAQQRDFLTTAEEFLAAAKRALEAEEFARAVHLAHQAQWWSLKAVVIPGGVTEEDARFVLELAETLYGQAREAIGSEPTEVEAALLARAARLIEHGKAKLGSGSFRGIGALWKAAVLSSWLLNS
jgi:HEPN domain-containing protein